jgi:hypothetical protein
LELPDPSGRPVDGALLSHDVIRPAFADEISAPAVPVASGVVRGRVLDQDDVVVADVTVSLYRGQDKQHAQTDGAGWFHFAELRPGLYRLYVEQRSLPEGYLAPWRQQVAREAEERPTGIYGTALRLTAGAERAVDLRVFAAGSVRGLVVGKSGDPVSGALVSVQSPTGVSDAARTDDEGRFLLGRLYPGTYTMSVRPGGAGDDADAAAPLPVRFELFPRQVLSLPAVVMGAGGHILAGTVVDLTGRPVQGLPVVCREQGEGEDGHEWETRTDEAGRFRIGRVPATALIVEVDPRSSADAGAPARIREAAAPLHVQTRGAPEEVELGVIAVDASRPFRIVGHVHIDQIWARTHGFESWQARVDVPGAGAPAAGEHEPVRPESDSPVHAAGDFTWSCATPHPDVELTVVLRRPVGDEHVWRQRVQPAADETRELIVTIP